MTISQIEKILQGRFAAESDRQYWEKRLAEEKQKEKSAKENEKCFRKNRVYDR